MRYKLGLRVHQVKVNTDEECVKNELSEISVGLITTHENKKTGLMCPAADCEYVSEMDRLDQNSTNNKKRSVTTDHSLYKRKFHLKTSKEQVLHLKILILN